METDLQIVHAGLLPTASSVTDADMILIVQAKRLKRALPSAMKGEKGDKGDSVRIRLSETAIQWQREGDDTWQDLITIEELQRPAMEAIAEVEKATNDAIAAETARRNSWTAWFENATTGVKAIWDKWFGDTKTSWNSFNTTANQAESARKEAETARAKAETARKDTETGRVNAENLRVQAETTRKEAETARAKAETARQTAETNRVNAETDRAKAETARQSAWVAWFEHSTTGVKAIWDAWFTKTKTDWNTFNTSSNQAERDRVSAWKAFFENTSSGVVAVWDAWFAATKNAWQSFKDSIDKMKTDCNKAISACEKQTALTLEINTHPNQVGDNGNWWIWNTETDMYEDSGIVAKGGGMYPVNLQRRNHHIVRDDTSAFANRVSHRRNHFVIKYA